VDEGDLREIFGTMGSITKACVHYNRDGRSQGTAEVTFARSQDAEQAVKEYDAAEVDGRPMYLKMIVSRSAVTALQQQPSAVQDQRTCFNCNRRGHVAAECNSRPRAERERSNKPTACFECGESGHIARNCPKKAENPEGNEAERQCFECKKSGHIARNCPDKPPKEKGKKRGGDEKAAPKAEDLDADMEDYFKKKSSEEPQPAATPEPAPVAAAE